MDWKFSHDDDVQTIYKTGDRHNSGDLSALNIQGFESHTQHLCVFNFKFNCDVKRMKINKKRPGVGHIKAY